MFSGIVEGTGRVLAVERRNGGARLTVEPPGGFGALSRGRRFVADLSSETLSRSTLGRLGAGGVVNLERALRWGDRLSGHFVLGHVDGISRLLGMESAGNSWTYRFSIPKGMTGLVVEKGSVALDGVSLTVASRRARDFAIAVIPETRRRTTFGSSEPGDFFNFEADVFARYGARGWRRRVAPARRSSR